MKNKFWSSLCVTLCVLLLAGCGKGKEPDGSGKYLYYVNQKGTGLVKESYEFKGDSVEDEIKDVLKTMKKEPDSIDYKSVFPKEVRIKNWTLNDTKLDLHFNGSYKDMPLASEVLLRAAVVQTLVQIAGVDYIDFFIEDEPLTDRNGNLIGYMRAEDFIQNTGSSLHSYQQGELRLYFANDKGDKLVREDVSVRYNSNISIEKLIVEQLIKGPSSDKGKPAIPPETKVLGVSLKDSICYVNLDEGFLNNAYVLNPRLTVYSIVNSVIDGGNSSRVQISINGESDIKYMDSIDLSKPLSRDLDIVEESGK